MQPAEVHNAGIRSAALIRRGHGMSSVGAVRIQLNPSQGVYSLARPGRASEEDDTGQRRIEKSTNTNQLTDQQQQELRDLRQRDANVRRHELAHIAAAGGYARSGARYEYESGPDGQQYAVGGEVSIDISPVANNPSATLTKAQIVKRAALAPSDPSPQDRSVAAAADSMAVQAQREIAQQAMEKTAGYSQTGKPIPASSPEEDTQGTSSVGAPSKGTSTGSRTSQSHLNLFA